MASEETRASGLDGEKSITKHVENVLHEQVEDTMSPWECIKANPKVVFWTLYANCVSKFPYCCCRIILTKSSGIDHDRVRECRSFSLLGHAGISVSCEEHSKGIKN